MLQKIGIVAVSVVVAGGAVAQSMPAGFYIDGNAEYSHLFSGDDNLSISVVDLSFGYDGTTAGNMPIGAELNLSYLNYDGVGIDPRVSGMIFYDSSFGRFSIGMPDPALDDYINAPAIGRTLWADIGGFSILSGSYIGAIAFDGGVGIYGARFDGSYNNVDYGISVHVPEGIDDTYSITAAAQYEFNTITASFGIEYISGNLGGAHDDVGYYGLLEADYGQFGGTLLVSHAVSYTDTFIQLEGTYRPIDDLELYAGYATVGDGTEFNTSYLGAEYTFLNTGYAGVSYTESLIGASDVSNLYVGYDFKFGG